MLPRHVCQSTFCNVLFFSDVIVMFPQNEQLKNEQHEHVKTLLKQSKENEKEVEQTTVVNAGEVEKALVDKINTMRELIVEQDGMSKLKQYVTVLCYRYY